MIDLGQVIEKVTSRSSLIEKGKKSHLAHIKKPLGLADIDWYAFLTQDFSTPSLKEENDVSSAGDKAELERKELEQFTFRRSWENRWE